MSRLRIGFVGFGMIGRVHAHAWQQLRFLAPELGIEPVFTAVCTGHADSAAAGARQLGAARACTDQRQVTEADDIDVVHVCSPNHRHAEALLAAMGAGKHIYCDKPLTANVQEADLVAAALPAYRRTAQMTLHNRFWPAIAEAKRLIDSGLLGRLLELRASYLHAGSVDPAAPLKWKLDAAAGGGVINDLAVHVIDLVEFLTGNLGRVCARTRIAYPERGLPGGGTAAVQAEDSVHLLAEGRDGALASIQASKIATGREDELEIELHGAAGALRYASMDPHFLHVYRRSGGLDGWTRLPVGRRFAAPLLPFPGPKFAIGWLEAHSACLGAFATAVRDGRPGDPGLARGVELQKVLAAIHASASAGCWLTLDRPA